MLIVVLWPVTPVSLVGDYPTKAHDLIIQSEKNLTRTDRIKERKNSKTVYSIHSASTERTKTPKLKNNSK